MRRFLPTAVVAIIILSSLAVIDCFNTRDLEIVKRDLVKVATQQTQISWNNENLKLIFHARRLESTISAMGLNDIDQDEFNTLVIDGYDGAGSIQRVELAPDFATRLVYPLEDNEHRLGQNPLLLSANNRMAFEADIKQGLPLLGESRQLDNNTIEVHIRVPMLSVVGSKVEMGGIIYLVAQLSLDFPASINNGFEHPLEFLFVRGTKDSNEKIIPTAWRHDSEIVPVVQRIARTRGDFLLMARPLDGWAPLFAEKWDFRLQIFAFGMMLLLSVFLSNWFAVSRRLVNTQLASVEGRMSEVLMLLAGSAFTYTIPRGSIKPGPDDQITFFRKQSCREVWGVDAEVAEQDITTLWVPIDDPELKNLVAQEILESAKAMRPWQAIWPIRMPGGERKWLNGHGHPTQLECGATQFFGLVIDVTEQVERKNELIQQREFTHKAQKHESIGKLTGGVAHDFNNLLAIIMGNLELLRDDINGKRQLRLIDNSISASKRGADLTRNMLAFARKASLEMKVIDLNRLVAETGSWIGRTLPANIAVETTLLAGLWKIEADPSSTENALLNLILNARDAMQDGGRMTIETANVRIDRTYIDSRQEQLKPGRYVMLAVSDTGHGISIKALAQIFEPFFSTKEPGKGSGLGLSMVQGFMQQSGGTVQVYSEPNVGTTFKLYFKVASSEVVTSSRKSEEIEIMALVGQRILVVEDEPEVLTILVQILENAGFDVTTASTGDEAKQIFEEKSDFDLLLTDIVMPGTLQGTTLSQVLREKAPDLRAVFMSGYASEATVHGNGLRPHDIRLMKPVMRADLLAAVRKSLEQSQTND